MDELIDDSKFVTEFPLWLIVNLSDKKHPFVEIGTSDGRTGTPLFTDADLCNRFFAEHSGLAESHRAGVIRNVREFLEWLALIASKGLENVVLDPDIKRGRTTPITAIMDAIIAQSRRSHQDPEGHGDGD